MREESDVLSTQIQTPAPGLSAENEEFIENAIAQGRFQSRTDALNAGVEALRREALMKRIEESRRQLDNGECTTYDDQALEKRLSELHDRIVASTCQTSCTAPVIGVAW